MKQSTIIWSVVLMLGVAYLGVRAGTSGMGLAYVRAVEVVPKKADAPKGDATTGEAGKEEAADAKVEAAPAAAGWTTYESADPKDRGEADVSLSLPRTIGIWLAAFFTLCIFSFLYGDNVFYKLAEAVMIGVTAAYSVVFGFWTIIVNNLLPKLIPTVMRATALPALPEKQEFEWLYLIPLALSIMMLMRLLPWGGWISRWSVAFFIGALSGMQLVALFHADFVVQIQNTILPILVVGNENRLNIGATFKNWTTLIGVLSCIVYFFFSFEHKGTAGRIARLGIWFLMITFGASFGYTVMGRIALLAKRLEFLFDDWMWIIDPAARRLGL